MYSEFVIQLKRIGYRKRNYLNAPNELEISGEELLNEVKKLEIKKTKLYLFIISEIVQVIEQDKRIDEILDSHHEHRRRAYEECLKKDSDKSSIALLELEESEAEIDYYNEVLIWTKYILHILFEYLLVYYPDRFDTIQKVQLAKKYVFQSSPFRLTLERNERSLTEVLQTPQAKTDKLKAPLIALFCGIIHKIGIDKKEETESATVYCKRICNKFKLPYTDRVRQNYNVSETKKLIQGLNEKVLPLIDNETKILVQDYLDRKQPPKKNLYG